MAARRKQYDDKFRASAVVMLQGAGYPTNAYKLEEIARALKVPSRTLRRWFNGENAKPPDDLVKEQKINLSDMFENAARKYLEHAVKTDVIEDTAGNVAMTAAAIAVDKMRLLRDMPTEIISIVPDVVRAMQKAGLDPAEVFNDLIAELSAVSSPAGDSAGADGE